MAPIDLDSEPPQQPAYIKEKNNFTKYFVGTYVTTCLPIKYVLRTLVTT